MELQKYVLCVCVCVWLNRLKTLTVNKDITLDASNSSIFVPNEPYVFGLDPVC